MKTKRLLIGMLSVLLCLAISAFAACQKETPPDTPPEPEEVSITLVAEASVMEFETLKLVPVVKGEGTVTWKTSDGGVATVSDSGEVYGVKAGEAEITASIGEKNAVCKVTVTPTVYAHELVLSSEVVAMTKGKSSGVKASLKFNGAPFDTKGITCEWTAMGDGEKIASVETSDNGFTATFTGIAAGEAEYEAYAMVRGYEVAARVTVRVIDNVTILNIANEKFVSGEGAYNLALSLGKETEDRVEIGTVQIIEDGQPKGSAETEWTSENEKIAKVENGVIYAIGAGETRLEGSAEHNGKTLKIYVNVTVSKGVQKLKNVNITVQTSIDEYITIPEEIEASSVRKITLAGNVVFDGTTEIEGRDAAVIAGSMPYGAKNLGEDKEVIVETDKVIYHFTASVYTMIISDKDDFDMWEEVAAREAVKEGLCAEDKLGQFTSGYFVLGSDIEYNGEYAPAYTFMHYGNLYNWGLEWGDGSLFGFTGTFDGKGHFINGLTITGRFDAFVTTLADGVIKNVAFTNTAIGGGASVVARAGFGTIENVFIEFSRIFAYSDDNASAIFGSYDYSSRTIKNIVIDLSYCTFEEGAKNVFVVGGAYGTITNVFVIGKFAENEENKVTLFEGQPAESSVYAHCDFAKEFFDNEEIYSAMREFETSSWFKNGKVILPRSVASEHVRDLPEFANTETSVNKNTSLVLKSNCKYVSFSLKNPVTGVSVVGNVLTVDETASTGDTVTVVATSDVSANTVEYTLTVAKSKETVTLETARTLDLDLTVTNGALYVKGGLNLDLSECSEIAAGNDIVVKYGDIVLYEGKYASSVSLKALDELVTVYGEKILVVTVYGEEKDYDVVVPVLFVSKTINDKAGVDGWQEIATAIAEKAGLNPEGKNGAYLTGYFMLGADIAYDGKYSPYASFMTFGNLYEWGKDWGDPASFGFKGTFDGNGHTISGMEITGRLDAFVVTLSGGTIKNTSFVNATLGGDSSFIVKAGIGRIENIFVKYSNIAEGTQRATFFMSGGNSDRIVKNCIIDVTDCTFAGASELYLIGYDTMNSDTVMIYDGVYVVGTMPAEAAILLKDGSVANCVCAVAAFGDYSALLADETAAERLKGFDSSFWKIADSIVLPVNVYEANDASPAVINEVSTVEQGASATVNTNVGYVTIALKEEIAGVTLAKNTLTAEKTVAVGTQITVVVTSVINGKSSEFVFTVSGETYKIGDVIDMTAENVSAEEAGLGGLWGLNCEYLTEGSEGYIAGGNGGVVKFSQSAENAGGKIVLKNPITVKEGMNFIKIRMYIATNPSAMTVRFNRSDRTLHYEAPIDTQVTANVWKEVYLNVSDFAVDGKLYGIQLGYIGYANSAIYVDDITIVDFAGNKIDLNGTQIGYIGLGNYWHNGETVTGSEIVLDNGSAYCNANLIFATPVTVTNETKIILRIRMSKAMSGGMLAFFNSKSEHKASFTDASGAAPVSDYVDVTLNLSDFVEDGQFKSISIGVWGNVEGTLTLYIASIKVI